MLRYERESYCRRCLGANAQSRDSGDALPFVLPGARRVCARSGVRRQARQGRGRARLRRRAVDGVCTQTLVALNDGPTRVELERRRDDAARGHARRRRRSAHATTAELLVRSRRAQAGRRAVDAGACATAATPRRGLYFIRPDEALSRSGRCRCGRRARTRTTAHWFPCFDHPHEKSTSRGDRRPCRRAHGRAVERHAGRRRRDARRHAHVALAARRAALVLPRHAGRGRVRDDRGRAGSDVARPLLRRRAGREADAPRTLARTPQDARAVLASGSASHYPYPRYAQVLVADFIFGGMENTSATTLTDQMLHDERARLDYRRRSR